MSRPTGDGRTRAQEAFRARFGPWALVAGASEGLGGAFARALAARGVNLILVARRSEILEETGRAIEERYGVQVRKSVLDLAGPDLVPALARDTDDVEVGLVVYNAACSIIGPFFDASIEEHMKEIDVNCRGPLALIHHFGSKMLERERGGVILMSSMAAYQGSALISNYAATKAYNLLLAEGLWDELRARGIDVLACCAGATRTPNYDASMPKTESVLAPVLAAEAVVEEALAALGRRPSIIPGRVNRLASLLLHRLLPRRLAITIMGKNTRSMYAR